MAESLPLLIGSTQHSVSGNGLSSDEGTGLFRCARIITSATGLQENTMPGRRLFGNVTFNSSLGNSIYSGDKVTPLSQTCRLSIKY